MLDQVESIKELGKPFFFFVRVAMKSPWAVEIWNIYSLFMAICGGFSKTHHKTPTKKGLLPKASLWGFWFVFFGPTKKMNNTVMLKGESPNKGPLEHPAATIFLS